MIHAAFIKYKFNFSCQPVIYDSNDQGIITMNLAYCYFLLKLLDLLDTVFIVLKKKNSQLSFLHCYHHFLLAFSLYFLFTTIPGGPPIIIAVLNCFVHSCMYFYYFLTTLYPTMKTSVWKKRITQIQLVKIRKHNLAFNHNLKCSPSDSIWNTFFLLFTSACIS